MDLREEILVKIKKEFIGPGSETLVDYDYDEEIITENPLYRYSSGIIRTKSNEESLKILEANVKKEINDESNKNSDDKVETYDIDDNKVESKTSNKYKNKNEEDDEIEDDSEVESQTDKFPIKSTFGISFFVETSSKEPISINFSGAFYKEISKDNYFLRLGGKFDLVKEYIESDSGKGFIDFVVLNEEDRSIQLNNKEYVAEEHKSFIDKVIKESCESIKLILEDLTLKLKKKSLYKRIPVSKVLEIGINKNNQTIDLDFNGRFLRLYSVINEMNNNIYSVNLTLENINGDIDKIVDNGVLLELYQPCIEVQSNDNFKFYDFENIALENTKSDDIETLTNLMLYGEKKSYAVGHLCSADWEIDSNGNGKVFTTFLPKYEMLALDFNIEDIDKSILEACSYTTNKSEDDILDNLEVFVNKYEEWIESLRNKLKGLDSKFIKIAKENIEKCEFAANRMRDAIEFLENDEDALTVFQYAHEAMILQRLDINQLDVNIKIKQNLFETKNYDQIEDKYKFRWRPFQLAFILSNFESLLNHDSDNRDLVDLIWVATGGGKTESYLFTIATVILYRRLKYENKQADDGVAVIMRYTLRLLTAQQFERASALICALEYIRRYTNTMFGYKEISIGLWIGGSSAPNEVAGKKGSNNVIKNLIGSNSNNFKTNLQANTMVVLNCPWCKKEDSIIPNEATIDGTKWGYVETNAKSNHNFRCTNAECEFHEKGNELPIYVVDELIYKVRPTLIFGTVDKFAMITHKDDCIKLFGNDRKDLRNPELIIQDELHLISGPLGSTVGAYESAIDYASSFKGIKPKYIASTATIKNAQRQVKALYNREVFQFPPLGINGADSFFVKETKDKAGRLYIGLMNSTGKFIMLQSKYVASNLQGITQLNYQTAEQKDMYRTLVGYFNRLVDVGRTIYLLTDIIHQYQRSYIIRNGGQFRKIKDKEITSKVPSGEIPDIIKELFIKYDPTVKFEESGMIDVVSASSMISVGLDVNRLNSMYVMGQPKLTSEYIQATSRVGRENPGVVTVLLNSFNPRDLSHFEKFINNHQKIYQYVESSSVTPFALPSLEKSLPGTFIAAMRNTNTNLAKQKSVIEYMNNIDEIEKVKTFLINRAKDIDFNKIGYSDNVKVLLDNFCNYWSNEVVVRRENLRYSNLSKFKNEEDIENELLKNDYEAITSMRDVELESHLKRRW